MQNNLKPFFILIIDIVGYTLKTSLLTIKELDYLLSIFEENVNKSISSYNGRIIKGTGDGYIILFNSGEDAVSYVSLLLNNLYNYNLTQATYLKQIHLHCSLVYGDLIEKKTSLGIDYFGKSLNLAYRINSVALPNHLYTDEYTKKLFRQKIDINFIGVYSFKGINKKVFLFDIAYYNCLKIYSSYKIHHEIDDVILSKVDDIILTYSSIAAVFAMQPLPFIDISSIFFLQIYMIIKIGGIYGISLNEEKAYSIFSFLISIIGFNYLKGWLQLQLLKVGLPGIGGYIQVPLVFSIVYSFGKVISYKFYCDVVGDRFITSYISNIFINFKEQAYNLAKENKKNIIQKGKDGKKYIVSILEQLKKTLNLDIRKIFDYISFIRGIISPKKNK